MGEYFKLINSIDVLDILSGKQTVMGLQNKLSSLIRRYSNNENEMTRELSSIDTLFSTFSPFIESLTNDEDDVLRKYGRKNGSYSFEINKALRMDLPLSDENQRFIDSLDRAISKFHLTADLTVYRALNTSDIQFYDKGYMSTSVSMPESYASFEGYDDILEITLPAGTACVYLEWFKGAQDEGEMLLARGTSLELESARTEMISGVEKKVYVCKAVQKTNKPPANIL